MMTHPSPWQAPRKFAASSSGRPSIHRSTTSFAALGIGIEHVDSPLISRIFVRFTLEFEMAAQRLIVSKRIVRCGGTSVRKFNKLHKRSPGEYLVLRAQRQPRGELLDGPEDLEKPWKEKEEICAQDRKAFGANQSSRFKRVQFNRVLVERQSRHYVLRPRIPWIVLPK
jgi:hypothetical protein